MVVQERYEVMRAMYMHETEDEDAYLDIPEPDTPEFRYIDLMLQTATPLLTGNWEASAEVYETGKLRYGNANPDSDDFDSLADYMFTEDGVEIRLPWQLLNFANPSEMMIHDDYYENYGVAYIEIEEMYVGLAAGDAAEQRIRMEAFALEGWGNEVPITSGSRNPTISCRSTGGGIDPQEGGAVMGSEFLLYGYGLVCLSMLVFNILYSAYLRTEGKRAARRNKRVRTLAVPAMAASQTIRPLPLGISGAWNGCLPGSTIC